MNSLCVCQTVCTANLSELCIQNLFEYAKFFHRTGNRHRTRLVLSNTGPHSFLFPWQQAPIGPGRGDNATVCSNQTGGRCAEVSVTPALPATVNGNEEVQRCGVSGGGGGTTAPVFNNNSRAHEGGFLSPQPERERSALIAVVCFAHRMRVPSSFTVTVPVTQPGKSHGKKNSTAAQAPSARKKQHP